MKKLIFNLLFFISAGAILIGCAGAPTKSGVVATASKAEKSIALPASGYTSTRSPSSISSSSCPTNEKSLKKSKLESLVRSANACVLSQKWDRLSVVGDWIAQHHHLTPWGPYYLSIAAEKSKDYSRSLWMIELALKKSPDTAMLHYQKARVLWALGEFKPALLAYNESIKLNPKFADAHLFLAQYYFRNLNYKQAEQHFSIVVELEKDNVEAFNGLAETRQALGKSEKRKLVAK